MSITTETRWESFEKLKRKRLCDLIVHTLSEDKQNGMTAREIATVLYNDGLAFSNDRQAVQPRLTELIEKGLVKVICKKYDDITQRNVAVYTLNNV